MLDEPETNYLRYQTMKDGVARYVECCLAALAAAAAYRPLPAFVEQEGTDGYERALGARYRRLHAELGRAGCVSHDRRELYRLGHSLAIVLDHLDPGWKTRAFDPGVWLDTLLAAGA